MAQHTFFTDHEARRAIGRDALGSLHRHLPAVRNPALTGNVVETPFGAVE